MYNMYPDSYGHPSVEHDENPYSERGVSSLGHTESYPITVPAREQHPSYPSAYAHLAQEPLRQTEVEVVEVDK